MRWHSKNADVTSIPAFWLGIHVGFKQVGTLIVGRRSVATVTPSAHFSCCRQREELRPS